MDDHVEIRSFRIVFALERRLFRVDRWRLPLPYGIPVRGLVYAIGTLAATLAAGRLPVAGPLLAVLPAPVRVVGLPLALSWLLVRARVDGRAAHHHLVAIGRFHLGARRRATLRPVRCGDHVRITGDVVVAVDLSAPVLRRARIAGPARLWLRVPARGRARGRRRLQVAQLAGGHSGGVVIGLTAGETLMSLGAWRGGGGV